MRMAESLRKVRPVELTNTHHSLFLLPPPHILCPLSSLLPFFLLCHLSFYPCPSFSVLFSLRFSLPSFPCRSVSPLPSLLCRSSPLSILLPSPLPPPLLLTGPEPKPVLSGNSRTYRVWMDTNQYQRDMARVVKGEEVSLRPHRLCAN